jgi:heptosyltransferase III
MKRWVEILERVFRHGVVYPVLRIVFRNRISEKPVDIYSVRRILIFRFDRIGDMIVTTPAFRALKQKNPNVIVDVVASAVNQEIARSSPFVNTVYVLEKRWLSLAKQIVHLRKQKYDVVLNFVFNRTTTPGILANLISPRGFKAGQGPEKYSFYFNRLLKLPRFESHMADTLVFFVETVFGFRFPEEERKLEMSVPQDIAHRVDAFLATHGLRRRNAAGEHTVPYYLLNLSVNHPDRKFSLTQVSELAGHITRRGGFKSVLLIAPGDVEMERVARERPELNEHPVYETAGDRPLAELASLVEGALFVVTMDTSLVHFASAMQTPVVAFYSEPGLFKEWSPYHVPHSMLVTPVGKTIAEIPVTNLLQKTSEFLNETFLPGEIGN